MDYDQIDLHGLLKDEARIELDKKISNIIKPTKLTVIHGYNGGRVLKDLVQKQYKNKRIIKVEPDFFNQGNTVYHISKGKNKKIKF